MHYKLPCVILVILFFALNAEAKWTKCTITYSNGQNKTGYVDNFTDALKKSVSFKTDMSAKAEKIKSDSLYRLEFTYEDGRKSVMVRLFSAAYNTSKKIKKDNKKLWFGVFYEGSFSVMGINSQTPVMANSLLTSNFDYIYFNWPGEDYAIQVIIQSGGGLNFSINAKKYMRKVCQEWFTGKCNNMVNQLKSGKFKPESVEEVVKYYEKNCEESS